MHWSREKDGFHQDLISFQKPKDPFFLEAIISSWAALLPRHKKIFGDMTMYGQEEQGRHRKKKFPKSY